MFIEFGSLLIQRRSKERRSLSGRAQVNPAPSNGAENSGGTLDYKHLTPPE